MFQKVFPSILLQKNSVFRFCRHIKNHDFSFECINYSNEQENLIKIKQSTTFMSSMNVNLKAAVSALLPLKVLFIYTLNMN